MASDIAFMTPTVREADPTRERGTILRLLRAFLSPDIDERRLEWLYFANPHGNARVWVLEDNAETIGAGAAIPRKVWMSGSPKVGCVFGDFCVSPNYRSVGPALQLQRACMQAVASRWSQIAYDLPSASMMAVYRRLGLRSNASLVRMAKPLLMDGQVRSRWKSSKASRVAGGLGNVLLRARDRIRRTDRSLQIRKHEEHFGKEFDNLFESVAANTDEWLVERSSAYLNWRFREHPNVDYSIWTARRNGQLEAYAVTQSREHGVQVADLFGMDNPGLVETLVLSLADSARGGGLETLSVPILAGHPWQKRLSVIGFYPRESSPLVLYSEQPGSNIPGWLTDGDRDS